MSKHVLVLNSNFEPMKVVSWRTAILMLLDDKADMVSDYAGKLVRSASMAMPWPAVIRVKKFVSLTAKVRFSRQNVLARDGYMCCYCGARPLTKTGRPDLEELTIDHVVPRAQGKKGLVVSLSGKRVAITCWENVICACVSCNILKADRTPAQAGMKLLQQPRIPSRIDLLRISLLRISVPDEWVDFLRYKDVLLSPPGDLLASD